MSEGAIRLGPKGLGSHGDLLPEMRRKGVGTEAAKMRLGPRTIGYVAAADEEKAEKAATKKRTGLPQRVPVEALKKLLSASQLNVVERFVDEELLADPRPGAVRALLDRARKLEAPATLIKRLEAVLPKS